MNLKTDNSRLTSLKTPTEQPEKMITIQKAREVLGKKYSDLSDEEIQAIVSGFELLANAWLDKKEREVFRGKTISELTNE
jgi:hypothetical protein